MVLEGQICLVAQISFQFVELLDALTAILRLFLPFSSFFLFLSLETTSPLLLPRC